MSKDEMPPYSNHIAMHHNKKHYTKYRSSRCQHAHSCNLGNDTLTVQLQDWPLCSTGVCSLCRQESRGHTREDTQCWSAIWHDLFHIQYMRCALPAASSAAYFSASSAGVGPSGGRSFDSTTAYVP
jgi:hypothetical protein